MLLESLTAQQLESSFPESFYQRGKKYYHEKRVCDLQVMYKSNKNEQITAVVNGSEPYAVRVEINGPLNKIYIRGTCECPIAVNCKHVIATLLQAIYNCDVSQKKDIMPSSGLSSQPKQVMSIDMKPLNHAVEHWLDSLERSLAAPASSDNKVDESYVLLYQLVVRPHYSFDLRIQLALARRLKKGGFGSPKSFNESSYAQSKYLTSADKTIIAKLEVHNKLYGRSFYSSDYVLKEESGELILTEILATGRACFLSNRDKFYQQGLNRSGGIAWEIDADGMQQARFLADGQTLDAFFIHRFWYIDNEKELVGILETNLDANIANRIMSAPKIPPEYIKKVTALLNNHEKMRAVTLPLLFDTIEHQQGNPAPCLYLSQAAIRFPDNPYTFSERMMPVMTLSFDYDGVKIPWTYEPEQITKTTDKTLKRILRDRTKEAEAIKTLEYTAAAWIRMIPELARINPSFVDKLFLNNEYEDPLDFSLHDIPELERAGFRIEMAEDYPFRIINDPIEEWYSTIEESSGIDWFGLELGVTIRGEKINLLPIMQKLLLQLRTINKDEINQMQSMVVQLPDRRYIALSAERIRLITNVLVELYDSDSLMNDQLRLSKWHAARLPDLEKACGASNLRWIGGDRLRQLGAKLASFKGIQLVNPADEFKGHLRGYQQEGLSWLQFLREYELGGVLADDMGLGKTVQAIAHIQLEKASGRMQHPALVVAPTSLMFNWCAELEKFSPNLKVLMLHGPKRISQFDRIGDYDLIITTYPLLVRDKDILLQQRFYFFILDEAQFIKNAKSQAAQVAMQIKTTHRLCLTGTPTENHLGELWSLFHFMMPGFLGNEATFQRLFRTPIEKHGDHERQLHLNKRIAPFLLRRTKDKVVKELPDKVEMIRHAELDSAQRDLYETIRITMHKKVRQEIAKTGMARSHIIILDALLKLRQVCCDPRLLKITSTKSKTYQSAKLELLMALLTELLEEGRRVLVFSQFAEMLGLIEQELEKHFIEYVKLTGQTKDRQTPIQRFQAGEVPVFLISLKAGGTGLNLTAADTVIHYDPWWNPAVENQATDRAHRIGQDKTVFVYKLIAKGTLEEKMLEMQRKKSALMQSLFSETQTTGLKLSEQDLQKLFEPLE